MKYHINIYSKKSPVCEDKDQNLNSMANLNVINRLQGLHRSQSAPNNSLLSPSPSHSDTLSRLPSTDNSNGFSESTRLPDLSPGCSTESVLDINSNITYKNRGSIEDSDNTDSLDKDDSDNNNSILKRYSVDRSDSIQGEDSGFSSSSSGCLSEEKDDLSLRSHDCSFECEEKFDPSNCAHRFSFSSISRSRSFSLDSASSDISDGSELNSKLSSSLPSSYIDYNKHLSLLDKREHASVPSVVVQRKNSLKIKKRKLVSRSHKSSCCTIDDHNNNRSITTTSNLHSRLWSAPFQFADAFQNRGFLSFVGCICYTLLLVCVLGFMALLWQGFKQFITTKDLKDLRDSAMESKRRREQTTYASNR